MKLEFACKIIAGALSHAASKSARPIAIVVLDAGGNPVASQRQDDSSLFRIDIARAKAMGALGMGSDTRLLAERAKQNPVFFASVNAAVGGELAFSPGGNLVRDAAGALLGAVGISGDTGDMDEECALAGITAATKTGEVQ